MKRIDDYADRYLQYFEEIYSDTGIWSQAMIVEYYRSEAKNRRQNIIQRVEERLMNELVIGHSGHNTVTIPWRTKNLHVVWEDISDTIRSVKELEIR